MLARHRFFGFIVIAALAGCGTSTGDSGGLNIGVTVDGLTASQHFCMTWKLYQEPVGGGTAWTLIDERTDPVCGASGAVSSSDFATCYDGRRFMVEYDLSFFDGDKTISTVVATSGGGPDDRCVKNTDTDSRARIQLQSEGSVGGVNPGIDVDQVCSNDKVELENGALVDALWLQPDSCTSGQPDSFCVLASGDGISTVRTGVTSDGLTRYIFNTAPLDASWDTFYLSFDPGLADGQLHLYNAPWTLHHYGAGGTYGREELASLAAWQFVHSVGTEPQAAIGFAQIVGDQVRVVYDLAGSCNAALNRDAQVQTFPVPRCASGTLADAKGAIASGGSAFALVFDCGAGNFLTVPCDAVGRGGALCEAAQ